MNQCSWEICTGFWFRWEVFGVGSRAYLYPPSLPPSSLPLSECIPVLFLPFICFVVKNDWGSSAEVNSKMLWKEKCFFWWAEKEQVREWISSVCMDWILTAQLGAKWLQKTANSKAFLRRPCIHFIFYIKLFSVWNVCTIAMQSCANILPHFQIGTQGRYEISHYNHNLIHNILDIVIIAKRMWN